MKSVALGQSTSPVELSNVSPHGFWLFLGAREMFVPSSDQPTTSRVQYGLTTAYGSFTTLDPSLVTSHSQGLTGLTAGTTYHYRVISTNADGLTRTSGDFTFTTAGGS